MTEDESIAVGSAKGWTRLNVRILIESDIYTRRMQRDVWMTEFAAKACRVPRCYAMLEVAHCRQRGADDRGWVMLVLMMLTIDADDVMEGRTKERRRWKMGDEAGKGTDRQADSRQQNWKSRFGDNGRSFLSPSLSAPFLLPKVGIQFSSRPSYRPGLLLPG